MLKRRIAAALLVKDGWVVQSMGFHRYLPVGRPEIAASYLNQWGVDEIILLDLSATRRGEVICDKMVRRVSETCLVPLAVGGGIQRIEHIDRLLQAGADKVCLNQLLMREPELVTSAALKFGNQCIVASLDVIAEAGAPSGYAVYDYLAARSRGIDVLAQAQRLEALGAGELLLNAVGRDGTGQGFEVELYRRLASQVGIPVIALGGAGSLDHFAELFDHSQVRAACAGNFFHYTEHSVITTKAHLKRLGHTVRLETQADYRDAAFDQSGRLEKKPEDFLERLLYVRIEPEVI